MGNGADDEKTLEDAVPAAQVADSPVDKKEPAAVSVPRLVSRMEFMCQWFGLPRVLTVEIEHAQVPKIEMDAAVKRISDILGKADLGMASDEATLMGVARWFGRRAKKLLQERAVAVTVLWKPEICTVEVKDV